MGGVVRETENEGGVKGETEDLSLKTAGEDPTTTLVGDLGNGDDYSYSTTETKGALVRDPLTERSARSSCTGGDLDDLRDRVGGDGSLDNASCCSHKRNQTAHVPHRQQVWGEPAMGGYDWDTTRRKRSLRRTQTYILYLTIKIYVFKILILWFRTKSNEVYLCIM